MSTSGGMNHSGIDSAIATSATSVTPIAPKVPAMNEPPCERCSDGKRRCATSFTMAGVIMVATASSARTTMTGVDTNTTMSGAMAAFRPGNPMPSSHCTKADIMCHEPIIALTASSARSQKK